MAVLVFSALGARERREKAFGLGARAFVLKGANAFELLKSSIAELLEGSASPAP